MICFLAGLKKDSHGGGTGSIIINIAKVLSFNKLKIKIFDDEKGWLSNSLLELNIPFDKILINNRKSIEDYSCYLQKDDILILFTGNLLNALVLFRNANCRVLVWEVFYPLVFRLINRKIFPIRWISSIIEVDLFKKLLKNNVFYFIDNFGLNAVEKRTKLKISPNKILPIPIIIKDNIKNKKVIDNNLLKITYIGRSVNWKMYPLLKIIEDIIELNFVKKINIIIISSNTKIVIDFIKENYPILPLKYFTFYENVPYDQIQSILRNSDLHFAMGTAAIDGAILGIPTIVIDACYKKMPANYRYRWIYQMKTFGLGAVLSGNENVFEGELSMENILNGIFDNYQYHSINSYNYAKEFYDAEKIVMKIFEYYKDNNFKFFYLSNSILGKYLLIRKFILSVFKSLYIWRE